MQPAPSAWGDGPLPYGALIAPGQAPATPATPQAAMQQSRSRPGHARTACAGQVGAGAGQLARVLPIVLPAALGGVGVLHDHHHWVTAPAAIDRGPRGGGFLG